MALDKKQVDILKAPFHEAEHEFNPKGMVYLRKKSIITRLDVVDTSWEFEVVSANVRDRQAVVVGKLTVCGVARTDTGMQVIEMTKDGARDAGEAEKAATTDAFKRAAALHHDGLYLQDAPKDKASFSNWLANYKSRWDAYIATQAAKPNGAIVTEPIAENTENTQGEGAADSEDAPIEVSKSEEIIQSLPQVVPPPNSKEKSGEFICIKATTKMSKGRPLVTLYSLDEKTSATMWSRAESGFTAALSPAVNDAVANVGTHAISAPILVQWEYDKSDGGYRSVIKGGITKKSGAPPIDVSQMPD